MYVALALFSLLVTCVVFWSHRRRDIGYTPVIFLYITLDSSACTLGYNEFDFFLENEEYRPFDGCKIEI